MKKQELQGEAEPLDNLRELSNRHLQIAQSPKMAALIRVRHILMKSAREFFDQDGWLEVGPIAAISSLAGACEDFSTLFRIDYFGHNAFLIQTGQQHLETYVYGPIKKVYAFNQSYRAEREGSDRRLTTFMLWEAEGASYNVAKLQDVLERLVYKVCADLVIQGKTELGLLGANVKKLVALKLPFERMTYSDAIRMLQKEFPISWGDDLAAEHEKALGRHVGQPFFISHYPKALKFFNMKTDPSQPEIALSCDLLVPGYGEIAGSAEREDDYDQLLRKLEVFGLNKKRKHDMDELGIGDQTQLRDLYQWYLQLRELARVSHGGFGLGFERLVQWICDFESITEATEFPKNRYHFAP